MKHIQRLATRARGLMMVVSIACLMSMSIQAGVAARFSDNEYTGKLDPQLVVDRDSQEQVIFRPLKDLSRVKLAKPVSEGATVTAGRFYHALSDKSAILALLVEPEGEPPFIYADVNLDNALDENERFELSRGEDNNPYIWEATIKEPLTSGLFHDFPLFVQYYKNVRMDDLKEGERLLLESRKAFAKGTVQIQDKSVIVQYSFDPKSRKINPMSGRLGVDCDGDGSIDMDAFSAEAAEAVDEVIVFRVGANYVSTRRIDLEKNQILMRSHSASDYKRIDLKMGGDMPDFEFTDFNGKKHKLSEFRGKHVLIDFWGMWCPACRNELPYLKAAYSRFQARGLEIIGMNTDDAEIVPQVKTIMEKNGMTWPQAKRESITNVIRTLRIHSYPTTLLVDQNGKIESLNNVRKGQPALRGRDLLKSLDGVLEP
jgi:peroxiredoxin